MVTAAIILLIGFICSKLYDYFKANLESEERLYMQGYIEEQHRYAHEERMLELEIERLRLELRKEGVILAQLSPPKEDFAKQMKELTDLLEGEKEDEVSETSNERTLAPAPQESGGQQDKEGPAEEEPDPEEKAEKTEQEPLSVEVIQRDMDAK